jgi:hypothetical protein
MARSKLPTSFRFSDEARRMIEQLAELHGLSHTAVVEMAVRQLGRRDLGEAAGRTEPAPKKTKAGK